jgi:ABC-type proline/glycine betaine transport system permease subunit
MGMSSWGVLRTIELPLSVPVVAAGVRTALVINVGSATLVTYINAGGLGDVIAAGLSTNRLSVQLWERPDRRARAVHRPPRRDRRGPLRPKGL